MKLNKLLFLAALLMSLTMLKAQASFNEFGWQGSTPNVPGYTTTCDAYTVTAGIWTLSSVIVDGEVSITIPNAFDVNTIKPIIVYTDDLGYTISDASSIFDYDITTISASEKKFTVKFKNGVDYSNGGLAFYKFGYSIQVSQPITGYSFTVVWKDNGGETIQILGLPPVLKGSCIKSVNDFNQTSQGTAVQGNVVTNDHSEDGSVITVTGATFGGTPVTIGTPTTIPGKGTLTMHSDGSYTFIPDPDFTGTAPAITYQTFNGSGTGAGNLTIDVIKMTESGVNTPPTANDDAVFTYAATTVTGNLLNNDYDANGNNISVTGVTGGSIGSPMTVQGQQPSYDNDGIFIGYVTVTAGQLTINGNGTYTFVPAPGFNGTVNPVTYTVSDGTATDTATVNIVVTANKNVVYANNDSEVKPQGVDQTGNVLANDFNPNAGTGPFNVSSASFSVNGGSSQPLTVGVPTTIPNVGTLTLNADGTYTFDPLPTFVGNISVPYTVCNSANVCSTAILNLTSTAVKIVANDDPTGFSIPGLAGGTSSASVLGNDSYGGGAPGSATTSNVTLSPVVISSTVAWPSTIHLNTDGTITVDPGTAVGSYPLAYQICDKINTIPENCSIATVTVVVTAPIACYNPANTASAPVAVKHGITTLKRAGGDNGNWPMSRSSAHTVLESNSKGFVVTRVANPSAIANPVEGMMLYDTTANCLKIYSDGVWSCFSTPACP